MVSMTKGESMKKSVVLLGGRHIEEAKLDEILSKICLLCRRYPLTYQKLVVAVFTTNCEQSDFDKVSWARLKKFGVVESSGGLTVTEPDGTKWTRVYDVITYSTIDVVKTLTLVPGLNPLVHLRVDVVADEDISMPGGDYVDVVVDEDVDFPDFFEQRRGERQ